MDEPIDQQGIARARALLAKARAVVVLTGAGISAESGIPTFRDALTGVWSRFRPEDLATPEAFLRDPARVWAWYAERRATVAAVAPNAGHRALAKLEADSAAKGIEFTLVTQNVDGLHHAAGSRRIHELHGNIRRVKCFDHGHPAIAWDESGETPPRCAACGSRLRPDVVWFGEMLPEGELEHALEASRRCDVFLSVGTSGLVEPAASLAFAAADAGAAVIEVNPQRTPLTARAAIALAGSAATVLPLLVGSAGYDAPRAL
jgi:NAD-dependent deacetylase